MSRHWADGWDASTAFALLPQGLLVLSCFLKLLFSIPASWYSGCFEEYSNPLIPEILALADGPPDLFRQSQEYRRWRFVFFYRLLTKVFITYCQWHEKMLSRFSPNSLVSLSFTCISLWSLICVCRSSSQSRVSVLLSFWELSRTSFQYSGICQVRTCHFPQ